MTLALSYILEQHILDRVKLILENNTFSFSDKYYRQIKGTAMGTKFAPVYATLTVGYLEQELYREISSSFGLAFGTYFINDWKIFLDDCFIPLAKPAKDLEHLHSILNSLHKDFNFTLQYSGVQQSFLDVLVKNQDVKIETDIFYKETNSKQYILFNSCYPKLTKINIPYNLARRLRTIVSEEHVVLIRMKKLKSFSVKQNYPLQTIDYGINRAMALDKHILRTVKKKCEEKNIIFFRGNE